MLNDLTRYFLQIFDNPDVPDLVVIFVGICFCIAFCFILKVFYDIVKSLCGKRRV